MSGGLVITDLLDLDNTESFFSIYNHQIRLKSVKNIWKSSIFFKSDYDFFQHF